ncbi:MULTISPECIES: hypothetical protein [Klebsiella]|uniref:hypothetical protein n=1 Tax=Klebsiella TaxID=570 RepID=UPI00163C2C7A|nr:MULTISPECIES: hypothetical protein [Klebsiella]MCW9587669.1 hypothetical protein [Klebsiella pasteurii]MDD9664295.1 hypothetical protein [Klebsiella pasteurii]MDD9669726.1 hypothetical protein [Klebsiella pasteurii]MDD9685904.1 hypothetical protein [Klebsiella pasteurii]MDM4222155.1 hypothetical protein [Klebsiella pasteurii]
MSLASLDHWQIASIVECPRKCLDPLDHLRPVDASDSATGKVNVEANAMAQAVQR